MTDKSKKFYKYSLSVNEGGVSYYLHEFSSFHETPYYYYCLPSFSCSLSNLLIKEGETKLQSLKRRGVKFKKIHKTNSRIAFSTKQEAYNNVIMLKKLQLNHLRRNIKLIEFALKFHDEHEFNDLLETHYSLDIPNSEEFVREEYIFD